MTGLILNSPWFDLQGPSYLRNVGTAAIDLIGRLRPKDAVPGPKLETYGASLQQGGWTYDLDWKPLTGFPIRFGWIRAVRHGHAQLHRGLDIGVPSLILRSGKSGSRPHTTPRSTPSMQSSMSGRSPGGRGASATGRRSCPSTALGTMCSFPHRCR